jgi:hypothetical protein
MKYAGPIAKPSAVRKGSSSRIPEQGKVGLPVNVLQERDEGFFVVTGSGSEHRFQRYQVRSTCPSAVLFTEPSAAEFVSIVNTVLHISLRINEAFLERKASCLLLELPLRG